MTTIPTTTKNLIAILAFSAMLVACGKNDTDQAGADAGASSAESRSATNRADSGASSSGASSAGSSASGSDSSAERAIDDSVITTKAKTALLADTTVKGTDINVETNQGVVLLTGTVEQSRQKERAASIVKGINGVKSVENKVTVKK